MYKRILLTLDGSELAEQALPHAVAHTKHFQAESILLRVLKPLAENLNLLVALVMSAEETTRELVCEYLEQVAAGVREIGISVRVVTVDGYPHEEIVRFAEIEQVDLIVICTRGQSGLNRWLMGSVADRVMRGVSIPVLLVRACKARIKESTKVAAIKKNNA